MLSFLWQNFLWREGVATRGEFRKRILATRNQLYGFSFGTYNNQHGTAWRFISVAPYWRRFLHSVWRFLEIEVLKYKTVSKIICWKSHPTKSSFLVFTVCLLQTKKCFGGEGTEQKQFGLLITHFNNQTSEEQVCNVYKHGIQKCGLQCCQRWQIKKAEGRSNFWPFLFTCYFDKSSKTSSLITNRSRKNAADSTNVIT